MSETLEQTIARIKSKWPEHWGLPGAEKRVEPPKESNVVRLDDAVKNVEEIDWKKRAANEVEEDGWDAMEPTDD